jgi:hypothetical protein
VPKLSCFRVCTNLGNVSGIVPLSIPPYSLCAAELNQLTGIAAILTFPLDIEVVEAEEREAKEEEERKKAEAAGDAQAE